MFTDAEENHGLGCFAAGGVGSCWMQHKIDSSETGVDMSGGALSAADFLAWRCLLEYPALTFPQCEGAGKTATQRRSDSGEDDDL
jgi:hypothetical protein